MTLPSSYPRNEVTKNVFVRWGDVLEEWNRGRRFLCLGENDDDKNCGKGGDVQRVSWSDGHGDNWERGGRGTNEGAVNREEIVDAGNVDNVSCDVSELTLLHDATAVFVYLLPKGLEKIKRILREAARIRHKQRQLATQNQYQSQLQLRQQHNQLHPLQKTQLLGISEKEEASSLLSNTTDDDQDGVEFCPLPAKHHRKRGDSHVSDITDDSFYYTRTSLEGMGLGNNNMELLRILHEEESHVSTLPKLVSSTTQRQMSSKKEKETIIPSFRVVSYMFAIPGWTPAVVDRSSKGHCPIFLYENIHDEAP
jgi:hypothetical protein